MLKVEGDHDDGWWFCVHMQMRTLGLRGLIQEILGVSLIPQLQLWVSSPALAPTALLPPSLLQVLHSWHQPLPTLVFLSLSPLVLLKF